MLSPNDVKQEISYIYLRAMVTHSRYSLERTCIDRDSVDATICAKEKIPGSKGIILSPKIDVQLKASMQECSGNSFPFSISKKNYDELRQNTMVPRILIVLFLPKEEDWFKWDLEKILVHGKAYWLSLKGMEARTNLSDMTIYLSQRLMEENIQEWMISAANREEISYVSC